MIENKPLQLFGFGVGLGFFGLVWVFLLLLAGFVSSFNSVIWLYVMD